MRKIAVVTAVMAGLAAASTSASAQSFQGAYVGAQAGWNHDKVKNAPWENFGLPLDESKDALTGGLFLGYDHLVTPSVVLGLEAGVSAATKDKVRSTESGAALELDPKYSIDVSARAGYVLAPATMIYARAGYSNLRTKTTQSGKDGSLEQNSNLDGWMAGGGFERLLGPNVSTRLEYRYSDFSGNGSDLKRHQVLLGAAYRF